MADPTSERIAEAQHLLTISTDPIYGESVKDRLIARADVQARLAEVEEQRTANLIAMLALGKITLDNGTTGYRDEAVAWLLDQVAQRVGMPQFPVEKESTDA